MKKRISYKTAGTCSQNIEFYIDENNIVTDIKFLGGCNGNLGGISLLCEGMKAQDIVERLKDVKCGLKPTSCPDQLAKAIESSINS